MYSPHRDRRGSSARGAGTAPTSQGGSPGAARVVRQPFELSQNKPTVSCQSEDVEAIAVLVTSLGSPVAELAGDREHAIAAGEASGALASLALAEVCSGPAHGGNQALVERYAEELTSLENIRIVPLDADVAVDAAVIRSTTSLSIGDAIHLACARKAAATVFVTNDRRVSQINWLEVAYLDEL